MSKRIMITGGAGFIGSRLAKALCDKNEVLIFDNFHPQVHGLLDVEEATGLLGRCQIARGDISVSGDVQAIVKAFNPDLIYHLAAETGTGQSYDEPTRYNVVNVVGTCNLIEAVRAYGPAVKRIVLSSSRAVYGEGAAYDALERLRVAPPRQVERMNNRNFGLMDELGGMLKPAPTPESLAPSPASIYASTKLMQEYVCTQCVAGTGVEVVILRLQNVFGPGQSLRNPYTGVISIFCQKVSQGEVLEVFEDGNIIRDFVYVDDVVEAFCLCAKIVSAPLSPVNIGTGKPVSIVAMTRAILECYDRPVDSYEVTGHFRAGDVRYAVADIALAEKALNWRPKTDFISGLKQYVVWARERQNLS